MSLTAAQEYFTRLINYGVNHDVWLDHQNEAYANAAAASWLEFTASVNNSIMSRQTVLQPSGDATGVTDKAALEALAITIKASGLPSVVVLSGDYYINGKLTFDAITALDLLGVGARVYQTMADRSTFYLYNCIRCSVRGIHFIGKGTEDPWSGGASFNSVGGIFCYGGIDNSIVKNRLTNHAGGGIVQYNGSQGVKIIRNVIVGMGSSVINGGDNGSDGGISIGWAHNIDENKLIAHNDVSGHAFGIFSGRGSAVISSNNVHDIPGQHGLYISQGGDLSFCNNTITDCFYVGAKIQNTMTEDIYPTCNIEGNTVARVGNVGLSYVSAGTGDPYYTHNANMVGNNVYDSGYAYYVKNCKNFYFGSNRANKCSVYGAEFNNSSGIVDGLHVSDSEYAGVHVADPINITLDNIHITDCPRNTSNTAQPAWQSAMIIGGTSGVVNIGNVSMKFLHETPNANLLYGIYSAAGVEINRVGSIQNYLDVDHEFLGTVNQRHAMVDSLQGDEGKTGSWRIVRDSGQLSFERYEDEDGTGTGTSEGWVPKMTLDADGNISIAGTVAESQTL